MKKIISMILAIIMLSMATVASAVDAIVYPDKYYQLEDQLNQLDYQFQVDNPHVIYKSLSARNFNGFGVYVDPVNEAIGGFLVQYYIGYTGAGYYINGGETTIYNGHGDSMIVTQLYPDPNPQVTKNYLNNRANIKQQMEQIEDQSFNNVIDQINYDNSLYRNIRDQFDYWSDDCTVVEAFQIGNYMFWHTNITRLSNMIEEGNRNAAPVIQNGTTLLPIRPLVECLYGTCDYSNGVINCQVGNVEISMTIGDTNAIVNGKTVQMSVPAQIINGKTMVPLRFVSENLGKEVEWIGDTKTILIKKAKHNVANYDIKIPQNYVKYDDDVYSTSYETLENTVVCMMININDIDTTETSDILDSAIYSEELMNPYGILYQEAHTDEIRMAAMQYQDCDEYVLIYAEYSNNDPDIIDRFFNYVINNTTAQVSTYYY